MELKQIEVPNLEWMFFLQKMMRFHLATGHHRVQEEVNNPLNSENTFPKHPNTRYLDHKNTPKTPSPGENWMSRD